ncbi:carboxypeptidase-like regulatory domain-containing protein [Allorhodopirellula solitaria]|uniref:Dioxygenase n=1 Tax=Allorhodopirellula solitaria TaxID=2527987 RepID=A0A5C5YGH6_9BACT|nr:carboxypeptidase-like regulatory domain-containing protein [Allorhodopirellula solitaria]TWT74099.1 Dioxygenase [Allorhodopirellula solitaria]
MTSRISPIFGFLIAGLLAISLVTLKSSEGGETSPDATTSKQSFELRVVDFEGRPVPNAAVEVRCRPKLERDQVVIGEFKKVNAYGTNLTADSHGVLRIEAEPLAQNLSFSIKAKGFAPYWAEFDQDQDSLPASFTASIEPAWTVGGVVLDAGGRPVVGAEVRPSIRFRKRPGDLNSLGVGTSIKTDEDGRWQYGHVPVSKADVYVTVNHDDYQAQRGNLSRGEFESTSDQPSMGKLTLTQGYTLAGIVRDPEGNPIENATVRTKFLNEIREAKTDEYGRYQLTGCEENLTRVVVFAKGRALEMKEVRIRPEMDPVDFVLPPGGHVKLRVVDADGKGLAKARIFLQRWRGHVDYFEFDHVHCYTDENGIWEWNEAPLDAFQADICRRGGMQLVKQVIVAGDEEHVFRPPPLLVITGRVLDAESGEPVTRYRVTPGRRNDDPRIGFDWYEREAYTAKTSNYRVEFNRSGDQHLVRIEAEGYRVAQSREFASNEGEVTYDLKLQKATSITGQIVDAHGEPASHARIAVADEHAQIVIRDGEIRDSSTYTKRLDADAVGNFSLPARDQPFHLVIIHDQGHAFVFSESIKTDGTIRLNPWASIEGQFRVGAKPAANVRLSISGGTFRPVQGDAGRVYADATATTDEHGRYRHAKVFDGRGSVGREIIMMVDDGATEVTSSQQVPFTAAPGEDLTVDIGGVGRPVTGQLLAPVGNRDTIAWSLAMIDVKQQLVSPIPPVDRQALMQQPGKWEAWLRTPPGLNYLASHQRYQNQRNVLIRYRATVARNGSFRIDDMPAGDYELTARLGQGQNGSIRGYKFSIPPMENSRADEALDLGGIQLED